VRSDLFHYLGLRRALSRHLLVWSLSLYCPLMSDTTTANPLWLIPGIIVDGWLALCKTIWYYWWGIFWGIFTITGFGQRNDCEVSRPTPLYVMRAYNWWLFLRNFWLWLNFKFEVVRDKSFRQIIRHFPYFLNNLFQCMLIVHQNLWVRLRKALFTHESLKFILSWALAHLFEWALNIVKTQRYLVKIQLVIYSGWWWLN
jgi:hypothetical protein